MDKCVEGTLRSSHERSGICFGGFRPTKHVEEPRLRALPSPKRLRAGRRNALRRAGTGFSPGGAPQPLKSDHSFVIIAVQIEWDSQGGWVHFIEFLDCHSSISKPGSPLRRRERGEIFSFVIQSRLRRDWITRLSPSGIDSGCFRPLSGYKRGFF